MSKRAEELATDAYPGQMFTTCARGNRFAAGPLFRGAFIRGYELAEKDIKDALLEWLDGKLTIEGATEGFVGGYDSALKDVIDKINSL